MEDAIVVRRFKLRPHDKPVPIYSGRGEPIPADWMAIVHWRESHHAPESFSVTFLSEDGTWLEGLNYDTLDIALDQAASLTGVKPEEWEVVEIAAEDEDLGPWPD